MIILASQSWLRKLIMDSSRLKYKIIPANIDERNIEKIHGKIDPRDLAFRISEAKANLVHKLYPNNLVIAADTFIILPNGLIMHKPKSDEEAIQMCLAQSGKTVLAITGLSMIYKDISLQDFSVTKISYVKFDRSSIISLLKNDNATIRNAALGFFQDAPGFSLVEKFEGSYTGAMGLPMEIVWQNLKKLNYSKVESDNINYSRSSRKRGHRRHASANSLET